MRRGRSETGSLGELDPKLDVRRNPEKLKKRDNDIQLAQDHGRRSESAFNCPKEVAIISIEQDVRKPIIGAA